MPDLPLFFRWAVPARSLPLLALFAFAGFAAPAAAEDAALPYDRTPSAHAILTRGEDEQAAGSLQNSERDDKKLLPTARPQDDAPARTWLRDYFPGAGGDFDTQTSKERKSDR